MNWFDVFLATLLNDGFDMGLKRAWFSLSILDTIDMIKELSLYISMSLAYTSYLSHWLGCLCMLQCSLVLVVLFSWTISKWFTLFWMYLTNVNICIFRAVQIFIHYLVYSDSTITCIYAFSYAYEIKDEYIPASAKMSGIPLSCRITPITCHCVILYSGSASTNDVYRGGNRNRVS